MNVSDFIDYLDLTIETPYFIWRKEMRQEIWKIISEINDVILMEIESFGQSHISMYSNAVIIEKFRDVIRKPEYFKNLIIFYIKKYIKSLIF